MAVPYEEEFQHEQSTPRWLSGFPESDNISMVQFWSMLLAG